MSAIELDRTDLMLLAELQRAGRQTNAELAERVHLSASACLRRVQRLEREGVIAGYRAELLRAQCLACCVRSLPFQALRPSSPPRRPRQRWPKSRLPALQG